MTDSSSPRTLAPNAASPPPRPLEARPLPAQSSSEVRPGPESRAEPAPAPPEPRPQGFAAQFDHTSLWDLVQFECLRRSQRILRISSRGQIGFLYFRAGQIVHASTLRAAGEQAVREMLAWRAGSVEPWTGAWPERETITISWQSLLLGVAESAGAGGLPVASFASAAAPVAANVRSSPPPLPPTAPDVETVVLARNGRVLRGSATRGLPEAAAYAAQMADLIGEFLGLDGFRSLEASFEKTHYLVTRGADGELVAQRGSDPSRFELPAETQSQGGSYP